MTEKEIEEKRLYIKNHPTTYWTSHEVVDREYRNGVIDGLTAAAIHASIDGVSYGKYKGSEFYKNGRVSRPFLRTADNRILKANYGARKGRPLKRKISESEAENIIRLYINVGETSAQIAKKYGVVHSTVLDFLHRHNVAVSAKVAKRRVIETE